MIRRRASVRSRQFPHVGHGMLCEDGTLLFVEAHTILDEPRDCLRDHLDLCSYCGRQPNGGSSLEIVCEA